MQNFPAGRGGNNHDLWFPLGVNLVGELNVTRSLPVIASIGARARDIETPFCVASAVGIQIEKDTKNRRTAHKKRPEEEETTM